MREYFRPNFWPNTPDILHRARCRRRPAGLRGAAGAGGDAGRELRHLRPGLRADASTRRASRAARSTSTPRSTSCAHWDLDRPDSLRDLIARVNRIRRENPALQQRLRACASTDRQRADHLLHQDDADGANVIAGRRQPRSAPRAVGLGRARPRRARARRADEPLPGARPADRRALPLARRAQLRRSSIRAACRRTSSGCAGACAPSATSTTSSDRLRRRHRRRDARTAPRTPRTRRPATTRSGTRTRSSTSSTSGRSSTRNGDGIGDFQRPDAQARLPPGPRRHRDLAAAVLSVAAARRRLRHRRLRRRPPAVRHARRLPAASATRRTGAACKVITELVINHTSDQHPWFQRARRAPPGSPRARLLRLERHRPEVPGHAHHLHRHRDLELDLGPGRQGVLLAPLLQPPARPQLRQPARCSRRSSRPCASGSTWASTASGSTRSPT